MVWRSSLGGIDLAAKVVKKELMLSASLEATLAEHVCGHPHLVDLKDTCLGPNTDAYLVYAYMGSDLREYAEASGTDLPLAPIFRDVLRGLTHLHGMEMLHTDITPTENPRLAHRRQPSICWKLRAS